MYDTEIRQGYVDAAFERINADPQQVAELILEESISLGYEGKGNGDLERIELAVCLMDCWPVIERMGEFVGNHSPKLAELYRKLKPMMDDRAKLVRAQAEYLTGE